MLVGVWFSGQFPVKRGVVQGDIFSPWCFIIALELLMRRHGRPVDGTSAHLSATGTG